MNPKKIIASLLVLALWVHPLGAEDESVNASLDICKRCLDPLSVNTGIAFESEYVYRGAKRAQENLQGEAMLTYPAFKGDLAAGVWFLSPIAQIESVSAEEIDLSLDYYYYCGSRYTFNVGFLHYIYPNRQGITGVLNREREVHAGAAIDALFSPEVAFHYSFDRGQWVIAGRVHYSLAPNFSVCEGLSLEFSLYVGYLNAHMYNGNQRARGVPKHHNSYAYLGGEVLVAYTFKENVTFSVGPRFAANNDGKVDSLGGANALGDHGTLLWWGASIAIDI